MSTRSVDSASPNSPEDSTSEAHPTTWQTLDVLLAGLIGGAGLIHLAAAASHADSRSWIDPIGFAIVAWLQIGLAIMLVARKGSRNVYLAAGALNLGAVAAWALSRTVGLPYGSHAGVVEPAGLADGICAGLEVAAVFVSIALIAASPRLRLGPVLPSVAAVAMLGLATVPLVTNGAAPDQMHNEVAAHSAEMAAVDAVRCDMGFNPKSYWSTAAAAGVDTYAAGAMAPHLTAATSGAAGSHSHAGSNGTSATSLLEQLRAPDPLEGGRTPGLDRLVSATSSAGVGEGAAASLVVKLAEASDADYSSWLKWMASSAQSGAHAHASAAGSGTAAPDDNGGHGGHNGPQPWKAMVDPGDCVTLTKELNLARATAAKYPTAADATAAGWEKVTDYVPGIAAHFMKFSLVDQTFKIDEPEMLLYDGDEPTAHMVGLSYYMIHPGDAEPTQGFTGPNDHFHRHVGLCSSRSTGVVIGDSTTTVEECEARGGQKDNGEDGWMSHAWVVPGCESPWGVFSGASPLLDKPLSEASGTNNGGCSGSSGRNRYDLSAGERPTSATAETASGN